MDLGVWVPDANVKVGKAVRVWLSSDAGLPFVQCAVFDRQAQAPLSLLRSHSL